MARIRTIKPQFWSDLDVCRLSRDARLTALAIISYADDRGRLEFSATAIRGYAFKHDGLSDKRVRGWMEEVINSGMALAYKVHGFDHLWLPKFWRHQVINRPTESQIPPHPEDPYGHLHIKEALRQHREDTEDSVSPHGEVTDGSSPRAQADVPFPSLPTDVVVQKNSNDEGISNPARRSRKVDLTKPPSEMPDELGPVLDAALPILLSVWDIRGGVQPSPRGVGLALMRNPKADHVAVARQLEHWLTAGRGHNAQCADIARRYGDWLSDALPAKPQSAAKTGDTTHISDLDRRRLAAMQRLMTKGDVA